uniref:PqiA/YebS family transporter subunit n=1 Tax=Neisseria leonii TaxID=2995413 RepID=UPI003F58CD7A
MRPIPSLLHMRLPGRPTDGRAALPAHRLNCPECGLLCGIPALGQGQACDCPRCGHGLLRIEHNPFTLPAALAAAALLLLVYLYSTRFISVSMPGVYADLSLPGMIKALVAQEFGLLADVMFLFTFGAPLVFLLLCLYVFCALIRRRPLPGLRTAARTMLRIREWMMVDVFFVSTLVAYIKLSALADVAFGPAFWLMPLMALLLARTVLAVPEHWVYEQIGRLNRRSTPPADGQDAVCCSRCLYFRPQQETLCRVCGSHLFARRPGSLRLSAAFLLAAAILYIPANLLPIMMTSTPLAYDASTIISGIILMWQSDPFVAAVIFSASIVVPTLKILMMTVLIFSVRVGLPAPAPAMSRLYRFTESVGRWSMIDIFVIIILMSAFATPMVRVTAGPAALYFCAVVLLTMLSAHFFDPRLLWDKSSETVTSHEQP